MLGVFGLLGLLILIPLPGPAQASAQDVLYGVTATDLVILDPSNLAQPMIVGAHGLPAEYLPVTLAYDPHEDVLLGLGFLATSEHLVKYDRLTGAGEVITELGNYTDGVAEAIEYVDSLGTFVFSRATPSNVFLTSDLLTVDPNGVTAPLLSTNPAIDQDFIVYDSSRDRFYSNDPNGSGGLSEVNLTTGATTFVVATGLLADYAYCADDDVIYGASGTNDIYLASADGPTDFLTYVGATPERVLGITFAPPPPPVPLLGPWSAGAAAATMAGVSLLALRRGSLGSGRTAGTASRRPHRRPGPSGHAPECTPQTR